MKRLPFTEGAGGGGGAIPGGQSIHRRGTPQLGLVTCFTQRDFDGFFRGP
ncbi:MAG TPA: hypothetical protein VK539_31315 [Myxococcaceae bacterium]|nr:hypothetical protein [Myxococcaceae bacterium]